jgi:hypothetical protein
MNQLCKNTREIWNKCRLNFKNEDKISKTVICYFKEFDEDISQLLLKSSILSCMDIYVLLKSESSINLFCNLIFDLSQNYVVPIEVLEETIRNKINIDDKNEVQPVSGEKYHTLRIKSCINKSVFEYQIKQQKIDWQSIHQTSCDQNKLEIFEQLKEFILSYQNNYNNFFCQIYSDRFHIYSKPQNNEKLTHTMKFESSIGLDDSNFEQEKEHLVVWIKIEELADLTWHATDLIRSFPNLKSVTFRNNDEGNFRSNPLNEFFDLE